jgi:hypothetical protein
MKPRILIVTQHFPPDKSGNASRIYDLAKHLVALEAQVLVLSPFPTFPHGSFPRSFHLHSQETVDGIVHINIFSWQPSSSIPSFLSRMGYYLVFPLHAILFAILNRKRFDVIITSAPPIFTGITGLFIK